MPNGNFSSGRTVPLLIPTSVRREWQLNGVRDDNPRDTEEETRESRGYEFRWGQIIEELTNPNASPEANDPNYHGGYWNFVLAELHNEFLDAGGNLGELSDIAFVVLDQFREDLRAEIFPEGTKAALPDFIDFDQGGTFSAFGIAIRGVENVYRARQWVDSTFIPDVLPLLISRLRDENLAASSPDPSPEKLGTVGHQRSP